MVIFTCYKCTRVQLWLYLHGREYAMVQLWSYLLGREYTRVQMWSYLLGREFTRVQLWLYLYGRVYAMVQLWSYLHDRGPIVVLIPNTYMKGGYPEYIYIIFQSEQSFFLCIL